MRGFRRSPLWKAKYRGFNLYPLIGHRWVDTNTSFYSIVPTDLWAIDPIVSDLHTLLDILFARWMGSWKFSVIE